VSATARDDARAALTAAVADAAAIARGLPAAPVTGAAPLVGYFCAYVPPELLLAAGTSPLRLRGAAATDSASGDAFLSHLTCSFVRHVAAAVLDGGYAALAGHVAANTCDHVRRGHDLLVAKGGPGFRGFVAVPRSPRPDLLPFYHEELRRLAAGLAAHFGVAVTAPGLRAAAARLTAVRRALADLDALRRADPPRLRGSDLLLAGVAARVLAPERFVPLAAALAAAATAAPPLDGIRARVLVAGGELDDPGFLRVLEGQGAHVAGDLLCWSHRGLGGDLDPAVLAADDPDTLLAALARAYLEQTPCARMMGEFPRRYATLREHAAAVGARGVIFQRLKFCLIWSGEAHDLRHRLAGAPLPLLVLEREYGTAAAGQLKTRVQAFLERLEA
jgi:benzoyl-CoA reductase subunit C